MADTGTPSPSQSGKTESLSIPDNLPDLLSTERRRFLAMDAGYAIHAERLSELEKRLLSGRFHLAVLGQVKRGKSTLLNALLGEDVLPSSVVPLTALPTFIQYGDTRMLRVKFNDSRPDTVMKGEPTQCVEDQGLLPSHLSEIRWLNKQLMAYVTEEANPENAKGVREVEIDHPAPILRDVVLIDTPGIGSTFRHNTEATMNFLPQCDAALFVISADPPITEVEVGFLKEVKNRIGQLFFVLNKADYLTDSEREKALGFYRTVLIRDAGIDPGVRIFTVSARKGLLAKESGDGKLWEESGLADVSDHLIAFLAKEKNRVLRYAISRKAVDVLHDADLQIGLAIKALELPLGELQARLSLFDTKIGEARQQRVHAQDILLGDQKRVCAELEAHVATLRAPLREQLTAVADAAMTASPGDPEHAARQAMADAIPAWFERELGRITTLMEEQVGLRLKGHEHRADELIESVRKAAAELFEIPYHAPGGERAYEPKRKPYWVGHDWDCSFSPLPAEVITRLLPGSLKMRRARSRIKAQVDTLVMRNLENLRYETLENIDAAFRKFSLELDTNLALTIGATHGAIQSALSERERQKESAAGRIDGLKRAAGGIRETIREFEAA